VTVTLYFALMVTGFLIVPGIRHLARIRKLVRAGYGVEDVLAGVRADIDQKREELAFTMGKAGPIEGLLPKVRWPGFALAVAMVLGLAAGVLHVRSPLVPFLTVAGLLGWVVGMIADQRRRYVLGERRLKYWGSRFGRWLFKLAGGRSTPRIAGAATHRPTELVLAFAAEDLYAELPKEVRAALPELPETLKRLELQARSVRNRIETLEQALADAGQDPSHGASAARREALVAELTASRDRARERLSAAVAALETIRLDLLRLRAGAGSVESLTADLAAAGEVGAAVDRLLEAGEELEKELAKSQEPDGKKIPD
jgi:xanthosine utilization system XapX-like protein